MLVVACMAGFFQAAYTQSIYKINDSKDNDIKLSGTSTLHDWTMNAQIFTCEAEFNVKGNNLKAINSLILSVPVENLKSKEKPMDHNAYKALKSDEYKYIVFKLISATIGSKQTNKYPVKAVGNLSLAGVTKEITISIACLINNDQTITCSGSEKIKMTDYQIKPPSFLLGAMETGDEIVLDFNLIFKK